MSRLLAVMRSEIRNHMSGRPALRMLGVASVLLLPAGAIPTPKLRINSPVSLAQDRGSLPDDFVGPPPAPKVAVEGFIPPSLADRLQHSDNAPFMLKGENPVLVYTGEPSTELRSALETLEGPTRVEVRDYVVPPRVPGRSLLIAILAISMLTGPLADALPGERARRTLEVLLTAGITRGELVGGKWLAWTLSASLTSAVSATIACWRGVQAPGWWLVGLPLFIASAVAFGLWLVRLVDDVVGGSAAPMRVLPVAAGSMAALAKVISAYHPDLAAAFPLGGPLLLAADLLPTASAALAGLVGTALFVTAVLTLTGRDLDRMDTTSSPTRWGAVGLAGVATLLWWLTVAGPGVWSGGYEGSATDLVTPLPRAMFVGGISLLACALVAAVREHGSIPPPRKRVGSVAWGIAVTLVVGALLAASGPLPALEVAAVRPTVELMFTRLREGAVPVLSVDSISDALCAVVAVTGQVVMFRFLVARRTGWLIASLLWALAMSPWTPWSAILASLALGFLAETQGWTAALAAHLIWSAAAAAGGSLVSEAGALLLQATALSSVMLSAKLLTREPTRHQL